MPAYATGSEALEPASVALRANSTELPAATTIGGLKVKTVLDAMEVALIVCPLPVSVIWLNNPGLLTERVSEVMDSPSLAVLRIVTLPPPTVAPGPPELFV